MSNETVKKILGISAKVLSILIIAVTVFMMVFTIFSTLTFDRNDRNLFGIRFYVVLTDSMSPSENNKEDKVHFDAGDIVFIKNVKNKAALKEGDVIAFVSKNSSSRGETVTHKIRRVEKTDDGKIIGYTTYGTNTGVDDDVIVRPEFVIGKYAGKLPNIGHFFAFLKTTPGYIVCILVPFLLLITWQGVNTVRLFKQYRREQMADMQAEKEKLEAERAENQRMMQELLALKAQLDKKEGGEGTSPAEPASEVAPTEETTTDETVETKSEDAAPVETTDENQ